MNITTIYQVSIMPVADGAESFVGIFIQVPTVQDVKDAIVQLTPMMLDIDILHTILNSVTGLPAVQREAHESRAAVTVKSAGVTVGTIRVTALPAFTRPTLPAILDRELAELIA